jgi:transcriptional regulator GlxA family with amidase domain
MSPFRIGIPVYPLVDLLDVAAPREVFYWMDALPWEEGERKREFSILVLAETPDPVPTRAGLPIVPDTTFAAFAASGEKLDLVWVPGADDRALAPLLGDEVWRERIRELCANAEYVTSVCTGAMLLGAAGLLDGWRATTHWSLIECLRAYGAVVDSELHRFVVDARPGEAIRITGGGVSSGIDEALEIVVRLCGRARAERVQQVIQYFPDPPVHATVPTPPPCTLAAPPNRAR